MIFELLESNFIAAVFRLSSDRLRRSLESRVDGVIGIKRMSWCHAHEQ